MTDAEKSHSVFNPGAPQQAAVTLTFSSIEDAAWFERCVVEVKLGGHSPLYGGILRSCLRSVCTLEASDLRDGVATALTPDNLKNIRNQ